MDTKYISLSFDIEEFDVPKEHGIDIELTDSMKVSVAGTKQILSVLRKYNVKATFFCTTTFAINAPEVISEIIKDGHEVASHGCNHFSPSENDPKESKDYFDKLGIKIMGYRQPRMFPVSDEVLLKCGYEYNSSLNPAFIPGRYMHLKTPRKIFVTNGLVQVPAAVTKIFRIPLFWLSIHHFPLRIYLWLLKKTVKNDGHAVIYMHPWEFFDLSGSKDMNVPYLIRHNSGAPMIKKLESIVVGMQTAGFSFCTIKEYLQHGGY